MSVDPVTIQSPFVRGAAWLAEHPAPPAPEGVEAVLIAGSNEEMLSLWQRMPGLISSLAASDAPICRMRFVSYQNLYMSVHPFHYTPFYDVRTEADKLLSFINSTATPSSHTLIASCTTSALEALMIGLYSRWSIKPYMRQRLVLLCDSHTYHPDALIRSYFPDYSRLVSANLYASTFRGHALPDSLEDLRQDWRDGVGSLDPWNSKLTLFVPDSPSWEPLSAWDRVHLETVSPQQVHELSAADLLPHCL